VRLLERLARRTLGGELADYEEDLRLLRERNAHLEEQVQRQAAAFRRAQTERDRWRAIADGAVQSRLEHALVNRWADLLDVAEPVRHAEGDLAGQPVCTKVPLHSASEVAQYIAKVRRETGYPEDLEGYRCPVCPRHPLVGRVRHVRHTEASAGERRLSSVERGAIRARDPLTQPLPPELLAKVREQLAWQTDDFNRR
jgi:hypothetical protein